MNEPGINTPARFIYLNSYAFLLVFLGVGIALISLHFNSWWVKAPILLAGAYCLKGSIKIFHSWTDKKRNYHILIQRNTNEFRPDTFKEYMGAPCGRLLVRLVLKDLNIPQKYKDLKR